MRLSLDNRLGYAGDLNKDIASVIVFLASDYARFVTGESIRASGGGKVW
jgi:NAD(P)-dependent dehydrogenase (short-subunit alcohol dehydrogenase family)